MERTFFVGASAHSGKLEAQRDKSFDNGDDSDAVDREEAGERNVRVV